MRIVIAPDKFRGSLLAHEAAEAMAQGVRDAVPSATVIELPLADGGEGTVDALLRARGGERHACSVSGPLGAPVAASWAMLGAADNLATADWSSDGLTAIVELAAASGASLVPSSQRDVMRASTHGTGELIAAALVQRPRTLLVALGGSATSDGGAGLLGALGALFTDAAGEPVAAAGGGSLTAIARVDLAPARAALADVQLRAMCDVDAVLSGAHGASRLFAPQKGATPAQVEALDLALAAWGRRLETAARARTGELTKRPGTGAAGGSGAAIAALGGVLLSGAAVVLDAVGFDDAVENADLVLTGEGAVDDQSAAGKVVGEVVRRVADSAPVWVLCGRIEPGAERVHDLGAVVIHQIGSGSNAPSALRLARAELRAAAAFAVRAAGAAGPSR